MGGDAKGPLVVMNLRLGSECRTAKGLPYRWDVKANFLYGGMGSHPREEGREAPYPLGEFF